MYREISLAFSTLLLVALLFVLLVLLLFARWSVESSRVAELSSVLSVLGLMFWKALRASVKWF